MEQKIIHALGWAVLHSLWQGILVGILAAITLFLMPKKWATIRYSVALGSMSIIFLMACSTFFWELSTTNVIHENFEKTIFTRQNSEKIFFSEYDSVINIITNSNKSLSFGQKIQIFCEASLHWVVGLWLIGVVLLSVRLVGGLLWLRRLRLAVTPLSIEWQNRLEYLKKQLNIKQKIQLVESTLVQVPTLIGWLKPMILLPLGITTSLTPDEVEMILLHELSHIRAKDYLVNIIQSFIEILFYYHPIVWWLSEKARTEREHRADDCAVKIVGNAVFYVKTLLKTQTFCNELHQKKTINIEKKPQKLTLALLGKKPVLLNRVKRILNISSIKHNNSTMERLSATALLLLGVIGVAFSNSHRTNNNLLTTDPSVMSDSTAPRRVERRIERRIENRSTIILKKDGKDVKAEFSNNEVKRLEVDGKEIPKSDWGKYEATLQEMREKMPPPPPLPPLPPDVPNWQGDMPDMPDMPELPSISHLELISDKDSSGNTVLKLKKGDGKDTKVVITKDGVVKIDGKTYKTGEKIRLESDGGKRQMIFFNNGDSQEMMMLGDSTQKKIVREIRIEMEHAEKEMEHGAKEQRRAEREMQRAQRELERAQRELERAQQRLDREMQGKHDPIEENMEKFHQKFYKDGLAKKGEATKIKFSNRELIVNGKKQPDSVHKEYLKFYEKSVVPSLSQCSNCTFVLDFELN